MNNATYAVRSSPFASDLDQARGPREIAILPSSPAMSGPPGDPMDVTPPPSANMGPPANSSPNGEQNGVGQAASSAGADASNSGQAGSGIGLGAAAAAAAATQQPKVVQTAFIHKLYNMLEDSTIQHLISWSNTNESFVMSPSNEFSKVLAQYFKHTNISSFVRQLNMYGFHKVSDVFHTGSPESTLWEFKHGNGNFKRGDLVGLREIKRRASRHALINRESFSSGPKASMSQPGTPAEPMPEAADPRLMSLEHSLYDLSARLMRTEENYAALSSRYQVVMEGVVKCHQWNHELSHMLTAVIPDTESQLFRELSGMQKEIGRQMDMLRVHEDLAESLFVNRQPHFSNLSLDAAPLSPRQTPQEDARRSSMRHGAFRAPVPPHLSVPQRRYGSVGNAHTSPGPSRPQAPLPPPPQHPLASVSSPPNIPRRHTSADIRLHGWQGPGGTPYGSGQSSGQWPSSPNRTPVGGESSQQVRDMLARYEMRPAHGSRQATPPLTSDTTPSTTSALSVDSAWSFPGARYGPKATETSAPPTRRSSMASNVHSLLNPTETMERPDEDDFMMEDRKRKRL